MHGEADACVSEPYVCLLPSWENEVLPLNVLVWDTFVASPVRLPYLKEQAFTRTT